MGSTNTCTKVRMKTFMVMKSAMGGPVKRNLLEKEEVAYWPF